MKKKKYIILIGLLAIAYNLTAQNPVIEENVPQKIEEPQNSSNQKSYLHSFIGYGFILGGTEGTGATINYGKSGGWHLGIRNKIKLSKFYSVGYELFYSTNTFSLKQDSTKKFPNSLLHTKEHLRTNELGFSLYNQFNFSKRENRIEIFIDIGAYGTWVIGASHTFFDKYTIVNNANASNTTFTNRGLIYMNDFNYGALARVGFNRIVFFGNWRVSNLFNGKISSYPELPRLVAGLQIGLY